MDTAPALVVELREKIRPRGSRDRLWPPKLPDAGDLMMARRRARRTHSDNDEQAAEAFHDDLLASYRRRKQSVILRKQRHAPQGLSGYLRVWGYLCTLVFRLFNDRFLTARELPMAGVLEEALELYIHRHLRRFLSDTDLQTRRDAYDKFARIDQPQIEQLTTKLAAACLRDWTPEWIEQHRAWGKSGGRPPGSTGHALADDAAIHAVLQELAHLSMRRQAELTGLSEATVRRAWNQINPRCARSESSAEFCTEQR